MKIDLKFYLKMMDLIESGSVSVELRQDESVVILTVERKVIIIDLYRVGMAYDLLSHFIEVDEAPEGPDGEKPTAKRGDYIKSNALLMTELRELISDMEKDLVKHKKRIILRYRGKDFIRIGHKESSIMARFLGFKNVSIPSKVGLMLVVKEFMTSKVEKVKQEKKAKKDEARKRKAAPPPVRSAPPRKVVKRKKVRKVKRRD